MTFVQVDDNMPDHPKCIALSDSAIALWLRALCYASRHLTDGVIVRGALRTLGKPKAADELVAAGLWNETPDGWTIHEYDHHQRTSEDISRIREAKSQAGTLGNHKRHHLRQGIVAPDCQHCRNSLAPATEVRSQTPRETSPESRVQSTENREIEKSSVVSSLAMVAAARDDRVIAAIRIGAQRDLDGQLATGRIIRSRAAYLAQCIADRHDQDGPALDALAANWPDADPQQLLDKIDNDRRASGYLG